jgi:hypothetical protein
MQIRVSARKLEKPGVSIRLSFTPDPPFDFILVKVGGRIPFLDAPEPIYRPGVKEDRIRQRGLSLLRVADDSHISDLCDFVLLHGNPLFVSLKVAAEKHLQLFGNTWPVQV